MPKLPVLSGSDLVRVLGKAGFQVIRQRGSHTVVQKREAGRTITTVVPQHKELATGTLRAILRQAHLEPEQLTKFLSLLVGFGPFLK